MRKQLVNQSNIPLARGAVLAEIAVGEFAVADVLVVGAGVIARTRAASELAPVSETDTARALADLSAWAQQLPTRLQTRLRVVAITQESAADQPNIALYHDRDGAFAKAYGARNTSFLVRPDGYIGWRGASWRDGGLAAFVSRTFQA